MGINIEMTGSGELGPLAPGWNVQEYATPVIIGESSGGLGSVSLTAAATENSLFVVNNNITTTEEILGSISGVVKNVSQSGLSVSITHDTLLSVFDATKYVPPIDAGSIYSVMDVCNQVSGRQNLFTASRGVFYTMRGHSNGFNANGEIVLPEYVNGSYSQYNPSTGNNDITYFTERNNGISANSYSIISNNIWANGIVGDNFSQDKLYLTSRVAFKTLLAESSSGLTSFGFSSLPFDTNLGSGYDVSVSLDYATEEATIFIQYLPGGIWTDVTQTASFASLDKDAEIAVFIEFNLADSYAGFTVSAKICNISDYSTVVTVTKTINDAVHAPTMGEWGITGIVRSVWRDRGNVLPIWVAEYERVPTYTITSDIYITGAVEAQQSISLWEYLQMACAAYGNEIAIVDNILTIRGIGERIVSIDNKTVPTISPTTSMSGKAVEISYSNSSNYVGEFYSARNDNNRIISVNSGETVTTTVNALGTAKYLTQPVRGNLAQNGVGQYHVIASNGAPVPAAAWSNAGGSLYVRVNKENPNAIDVTLIGPATSSTFGASGALYVEPYKLAYASNSTEYAALSIIGSGVKSDKKNLKLYSAADPTKTSQDIAKSIINPFISTLEQAYDRGIWASENSAGPQVNVSSTLPVSALEGFGLSTGSLFKYRDSIYRINNVTIGNLTVSFNASRHVLVGDFDTLWAGKTVGVHDSMWIGYNSSDQVIAPLRFIGDDESILMMLDTDVTPYYDFNGEPEISVFQDADNNPFYEDGGNLDGEDVIKLDTDSNPYDEGL